MKSQKISLYVTLVRVVSRTWRIFVVNKDESHEEPYLDTVIKIQCISTLQQDVKRSESLLNHFLGVLWKKQGVLSHFKELRNLAK